VFEINLSPDASRKPRRPAGPSRLRIRLPALPRIGAGRDALLVALGWVLGPALIAWMFLGARARKADLNAEIEIAVRDSARYAELIATSERLTARRDTIAQKLQIIQEIDAGRYVWAHLLDEISRALPSYTWLTGIAQTEAPPNLTLRIEGRTGNTFALTQFMKDLEASAFLKGVRLASTELVVEREAARGKGPTQERLVHAFVLEAGYEEPPPDRIQTVPLFATEN